MFEKRLGYAETRVLTQLTDVLIQKVDCIHVHLLLTASQKQRKAEEQRQEEKTAKSSTTGPEGQK